MSINSFEEFEKLGNEEKEGLFNDVMSQYADRVYERLASKGKKTMQNLIDSLVEAEANKWSQEEYDKKSSINLELWQDDLKLELDGVVKKMARASMQAMDLAGSKLIKEIKQMDLDHKKEVKALHELLNKQNKGE